MNDPASEIVRCALAGLRRALRGNDSEPAERLASAMDGLCVSFEPFEAALTPTCEWLESALAAAPPETEWLRDAIAPLARIAEWREGPRPGGPDWFDGGYAFFVLVGPDGRIPSPDCRIGLYLQRPGLPYPPHAHEAEELYLVISGTADWQAGERRFLARPRQLIHHEPGVPHSMHTGDEPFLAIFVWLGELEGRYWFL